MRIAFCNIDTIYNLWLYTQGLMPEGSATYLDFVMTLYYSDDEISACGGNLSQWKSFALYKQSFFYWYS